MPRFRWSAASFRHFKFVLPAVKAARYAVGGFLDVIERQGVPEYVTFYIPETMEEARARGFVSPMQHAVMLHAFDRILNDLGIGTDFPSIKYAITDPGGFLQTPMGSGKTRFLYD